MHGGWFTWGLGFDRRVTALVVKRCDNCQSPSPDGLRATSYYDPSSDSFAEKLLSDFAEKQNAGSYRFAASNADAFPQGTLGRLCVSFRRAFLRANGPGELHPPWCEGCDYCGVTISNILYAVSCIPSLRYVVCAIWLSCSTYKRNPHTRS